MKTHHAQLEATVRRQEGMLFAQSAVVRRAGYCGRDILAKNSGFYPELVDHRGYLPVEWWLMSMASAANTISIPGEGITRLQVGDGEELRLDVAVSQAERLLFGPYRDRWPLVKLLDIGGKPVTPDFSGRPEVPPIPVHVHAGEIVDGKAVGPGKLEAYFFPQIPARLAANLEGTVTRLGLRPGISPDQLAAGLELFGRSDEVYAWLHEYDAAPYDGWTVSPGTIHAPGPWPTIEVQTPQDDYNYVSWQLGQRLNEHERETLFRELVLRGLPHTRAFAEQLVDWNLLDKDAFKRRGYRAAEVIDDGAWGRRLRVFFGTFNGELVELNAGQRWVRGRDERPASAFVWDGHGTVNGCGIGCTADVPREWLAVPGSAMTIESDTSSRLDLFLFYPMEP